MIKKENKDRLKFLAGINESVQLISHGSGRSDKNTLGYYIEEYLLNLNSLIINSINEFLKSVNNKANISQQDTKILENTLILKFQVNNKEFILTSIVSFNENSNTSVSLTLNGQTEKFNLSSKHSSNDVSLFVQEIVQRLSKEI